LQFSFVTARPLGKDIEDQTDSIDDLATQFPFEVSLLAGRESVIEHHHIRGQPVDGIPDLGKFTRPYEGPRIGRGPCAGYANGVPKTSRFSQMNEFLNLFAKKRIAKVDMDEDCLFAASWLHESAGGTVPARSRVMPGTN
jgi:hypothetical protein